jgi:hypothetical protein
MDDLEVSRNKILEDVGRWMAGADPGNKVLIRGILSLWMDKHRGPHGYITVAPLIDAFPKLIRAADEIRARMPAAMVRKVLRGLTLEAFVGDLVERYPDRRSLALRVKIRIQVILFRCHLWRDELLARLRG